MSGHIKIEAVLFANNTPYEAPLFVAVDQIVYAHFIGHSDIKIVLANGEMFRVPRCSLDILRDAIGVANKHGGSTISNKLLKESTHGESQSPK